MTYGDKSPWFSVREYAAHRKRRGLRGCSQQAVSKALATGKITRVCAGHPDGCPLDCLEGGIDPARADATWAAAVGESRRRRQGPAAHPRAEYHQERAKREGLIVRKLELDMAREAGELIEADQVRSQQFTAARAVRDELLRLPRSLAPELCTVRDPREHERRHTARLESVLRRLADLLRGATE